jgi:hypothetical protein
MTDAGFVVVVPPAPIAEADLAFEEWLEAHGLTREALAPDDVRIDTGRQSGSSFRRYRVRREIVEAMKRRRPGSREPSSRPKEG